MELLAVYGQAFIIGLSGALMPGPLLTYDIQLSLKRGFWVGPQLILGHAILEALLILGIIAGLSGLIQSPLVKIALWLVGGALLLWMSYDLIMRESRNHPEFLNREAAATAEIKKTQISNLSPILAGLVISLVNPYWSLWWVTIGLGLISKALKFGWLGLATFFVGHITADLAWYSLVSGAVAKGRRLFTAVIYKWLLILCGTLLLFIAAGFIFDAFHALYSKLF